MITLGGGPNRAIAVCDNLEASEDGRRIDFSEPFTYQGVSIDALRAAMVWSRQGDFCQFSSHLAGLDARLLRRVSRHIARRCACRRSLFAKAKLDKFSQV